MEKADISCSVSQLNAYIKRMLEEDENLRYIIVNGEISNYKKAMNGHFYFSLKDDKASISAVLFKDYALNLKFTPKDGDMVKAIASISVFPQRGTYSLRVYSMEPLGAGELLLELEKLKKKLAAEGLFDDSRKKPINLYPKAIGLITAKGSAAIKDMVTNIQRRFPPCDIYIFPSKVQGDGASKELLDALKLAQQYPLDTIIIGRGGGSSEDLNAFNDEELVREAARCNIPIISAVGHEIDTTLIDYVADKRASTPTGAAELATVDQREIQEEMMNALEDMKLSIKKRLDSMREDLSDLKSNLNDSMLSLIKDERTNIHLLDEKLNALNPQNILGRGFTITENSKGKIIKSTKDAEIGDTLITHLQDGVLISDIKDKK